MEKWLPIPESEVQLINWYNFANPEYSPRGNILTAVGMCRRLFVNSFGIDGALVDKVLWLNQHPDTLGPTIVSSIEGDGDKVNMLPIRLDCGADLRPLQAVREQLSPGFNRDVLKIANLVDATLFFGLAMPDGVSRQAA